MNCRGRPVYAGILGYSRNRFLPFSDNLVAASRENGVFLQPRQPGNRDKATVGNPFHEIPG